MNSGKSNRSSFKYQRFTPSGCKDIGIRKFEFVSKTQFLYNFDNTQCSFFSKKDPFLAVFFNYFKGDKRILPNQFDDQFCLQKGK